MNDYETKLFEANQQAALLSWVMLYSVALIAFIAAVIWLFKMAQQRRKQRINYAASLPSDRVPPSYKPRYRVNQAVVNQCLPPISKEARRVIDETREAA